MKNGAENFDLVFFVMPSSVRERRDTLSISRVDQQAGDSTRRGQLTKLGFTVQLVPRYALLVRDQGRTRAMGGG